MAIIWSANRRREARAKLIEEIRSLGSKLIVGAEEMNDITYTELFAVLRFACRLGIITSREELDYMNLLVGVREREFAA